MLDCTEKVEARDLCHNHYHRWQKYGDALTPLTRRPSGSSEVGYKTAHGRVRRKRGSPSLYECVGIKCAKQAEDWAYIHGSSNEKKDLYRGFILPYSPDVNDYQPMCRLCHRAYDKEARLA